MCRNKCDFTHQRDQDLIRAYRRAAETTPYIRRDTVIEQTVNSPAERFYVSEERATIIINEMMRGKNTVVSPMRQQMFNEILRRVALLHRQQPQWSIPRCVRKVVNSPAPRFYLTTRSAIVLLHKIRKRCQQKFIQRHASQRPSSSQLP